MAGKSPYPQLSASLEKLWLDGCSAKQIADRFGTTKGTVDAMLMRAQLRVAREPVRGNWTPERIEQLTTLWKEGRTGSDIARIMGGLTRCAVLGKVGRLGLLKGRAAASAPTKAPARVRPPKARPARASAPTPKTPKPKLSIAGNGVVFHQAPAEPLPPEPVEERGLATVLTLSNHVCKWPIGSPDDPDFSFCGHRSLPGRPYCSAHLARAVQPPKHGRTAADLIRSLKRYA